MGRDVNNAENDTYITVPTFFRCPISLDVMKSPVSLCTGVTYDRDSIQRWLDAGNNTCPATMQVLRSRDLVPNRTLQRLIDLWSASSTRCQKSTPADAAAAPSREKIDEAITELKVGRGGGVETLRRILIFARESDENIGFLAGKPDFLLMLADLMADSVILNGTAIETVHLVIAILDVMIRRRAADRERLADLILMNGRNCLSVMLLAFKRGDLQLKTETVRVLESIAVDSQSKFLITETDGLLTEMINSIDIKTDSSLIDACLSFLITISTPKRLRLILIRSKTITKLAKLFLKENAGVSVTEKALKLLEMLASWKQGRAEICENAACVQGVVRKLMKVSAVATEHAVTILWCLCCLVRDERAKEAVVKSGDGLTKILLLMQSDCSAAVRQMAKDLLKAFRVSSRESWLAGYDTKTTHITPF